jgi:hypothetical protein
MEHLPIVIFEIVLSVFIAFVVFARILIKQITDYQKQIKKLEADIEIKINQYQELDELKADAELKGIELSKWVALARNFGCFNQSELYMMVESMKNQVDFLCKSRKPADPQYVDEWFRFKKMF